jgi:hypothetical protein
MARFFASIIAATLAVTLTLGLLVSCIGGGGGGGGQSTNWGPEITGPLFTVSPLETSKIIYVTGQGHLAPFSHTLPTPHVYLYWHNSSPITTLIPVVSPGPGTITFVLKQDLGGGQSDTKIMVRASPNLTWYMDHVSLAPGLGLGSVLTPGMSIGTTSSLSAAVDLGLLDSSVINPFIAPQRYGDDLINSVSPWTRFTPALRTFFDGISQVVGPNKDGAVCYDVDGTAAGNWFLDGVPDSKDAYGKPENWPKHLAFARDEIDPTRWRISVGGIISAAALWAIVPGDPEPTAITTGIGLRIIRLYTNLTQDGTMLPSGWLLVRMDANGLLYVQYFSASDYPPSSALHTPVTNFTGGEKLYRRMQGASG